MFEEIGKIIPESAIPIVVLITGFLIIAFSVFLTKIIVKISEKFNSKKDKKK